MKDNKKSIIDYLHVVRKVLTFVLFFSVCFYTAFRVARWNSDSIQSFFLSCYDVNDKFKIVVTMLLLVVEIVDIAYRSIKKSTNVLVDLLIIGTLAFVCLCFKVFTYYNRFIYYAIIIYFSRYVDFKTLVKSYAMIYSLSLLVLICGNVSGELSLISDGRGMSFGTGHSNNAGMFLCMYFLAISYLINNKIVISIIGVFVEIMLFFFIKSRSPFVVVTIFIILLWSETIYNKLSCVPKRLIKTCFVLLPILFISGSFVLGYLIYDGIIKIDANASVRFVEFVYFMQEKGISLSYCELSELQRMYYFDNGYGYLLFHYGLVACAIVTVGQMISNYSIVKYDDYKALITSICLYVYNLMEITIFFNDLPLLMIIYMSRMFIKRKE